MRRQARNGPSTASTPASQVAEYHHVKLPSRWWGARNWKKLEGLDAWLREQLSALREVILLGGSF